MVQIKSEVEDNFHKIIIEGDVDASSSIYLDQAISTAIESGIKNIFIDCRGLNYISSAGLGVFMSYIDEMSENEVNFIIYGLTEKAQNVFQILGLDQLLKIVESKEKAKELIA